MLSNWRHSTMTSPTRMMSASENRRSSRPYDTVPAIPPIAIAVVIRPKPTAVMPSRSCAYRTSTDQAAPKVTLNARIVITSVRIGGWSQSQRRPSAISWRQWRRSTTAGASATTE